MDKETAERLTKLETKLEVVEKEHESWNALIKRVVAQSITWLLGVGAAGMFFGWKIPENVRKAMADWVSR